MASKVQVAKFQLHDFNEAPVINPTFAGVWNMEEDDVLGQLKDESFKKRVEILEQLIITVKRNGGHLPYADRESIFRSLGLALSDTNWEIRNKCIQLLQEIIPNLGDAIDSCMSLVLNKMLTNIGDSKVTVRRMVVQALRAYMKYTCNLSRLFDALVNTGLENENPAVRREMVNCLPMLLTNDYVSVDLTKIIQSLAKKLLDTSKEDNLKDSSLLMLNKIEELVGEKVFANYLKNLSMPLRKYYLQLSGKHEMNYYHDHDGEYSSSTIFQQNIMNNRNDNRRGFIDDSFEFGIVPSHILTRINDQKDFRTRAQAVEDLRSIINNASNYDVTTCLMPHMPAFVVFLSNLLDDSNFKIITVTLEIFKSVVEKLDSRATKMFLRPLISALSKRMGDNKLVIRQLVMDIVIRLMRNSSPQDVLTVIEENLHHKNSRVRQETINFIIAALLTFPRYEFDLPGICQVVSLNLTDVKRSVRQAALECFAMLAQVMGSGQLQPLVSAVDQIELGQSDGDGLMAAVQARLARKQLPKLSSEGMVEYATPTPSSATVRSATTQSADTEWILAVGTGVSSSARTARSDAMELESVTTSARSTPHVGDISAPTPVPRRFMSAGRVRNKLPWEENRDERSKAYNELPGSAPTSVKVTRAVKSAHAVAIPSDDAPPRPRQMWANDSDPVSSHVPHVVQRPADKQPPKRRTTVMGLASPDDHDTGGSYAQLFHQKKRQQGMTPRSIRPDVDGEENYSTYIPPNSYRSDEDESPIPRKATMARGSATRQKVPPISPSSDYYDSDSAYAPSEGGRSGVNVNGSLKTIRNSATKKRADKLFEKLEKQSNHQSFAAPSSVSSGDPLEDSSFFSSSSHTDYSKKSLRKPEPVEQKTMKTNSYSTLNTNNANRLKKQLENTDNEDSYKAGIIHVDFNPNRGVTFRENRNADVQVVGKGYGDETSVAEHNKAQNNITNINNRIKDRRRFSNRGMFDTSANNADHPSNLISQSQDGRLDRRKVEPKAAAPPGVVGIAVRSNADFSNYSSESSVIDEDWDDESNISMTQSLKEKVAVKQQQRLEEDERRKAEKERKEREERRERDERIKREERTKREKEEKIKREKDEKLKKEKERQQEKLKRLSSAESINSFEFLSVSGSGSGSGSGTSLNGSPALSFNHATANGNIASSHVTNSISAKPSILSAPKQPHPAVTPRKTLKTSNEPISSFPMPVTSAATPMDSDNPADWKPFKDPDVALRELIKKIDNEDWELKCEGINMLRRLSMHHSDTVAASLHSIVLLIAGEVRNLRSQVSRLAITAVGEMYLYLQKGMDPELDILTKTLLARGGESNNFIREDVDKALLNMVDHVTSQRALLALITGGASAKNALIRRTTAQFLIELVEKMGSGRILSGVKDITDRLLPTAAQFTMDNSQETRYLGRKILFILMPHQDFDRMLTKYLPANTLKSIQSLVETLKQKGLGDRPNELSSARSRRSGHGSRSNSSIRGGSANSSTDSAIGNQTKRRALVRTDEARMEEVKAMTGLMSASNWQERFEGISSFQAMCETNPSLVSSQILKIFDKFLPRLGDSNSKVNLHALKVMRQVTPLLRDALGNVISMTVPAVAPNLSSKNSEIHKTAAEILDCFIENLDLTMLIQPFANQALNATSRSKADMVLKVAYLVERVYPRKQKPVVLHVLPLVWHLLGAMNSSGAAVHGGNVDLRQATATLVGKLYECMGQGLLDRASAEPNLGHRQIQLLQNLLE